MFKLLLKQLIMIKLIFKWLLITIDMVIILMLLLMIELSLTVVND